MKSEGVGFNAEGDAEGDRVADFLHRLRSEAAEGARYVSHYSAAQDTPPGVRATLRLEDEYLSETAKLTLEALESNPESGGDNSTWIDFKWKLAAFHNIQDAFAPFVYGGGSHLNMFHLWYFYYESKYILAELVLCGLNGYSSASNALSRLFLEFNAMQNYYYRRVNAESSFRAVAEYLKTGRHPSWGKLVKGAIPADAFCRPIRHRIDSNLQGLSAASSHPYHPRESHKRRVGTHPRQSMEGMFFWNTISFVLSPVLWMYSVNFPMLYFPRDTFKKCGFNPPMGLVVGQATAASLQHSMPPNDYEEFKEYASTNPDVSGVLAWLEGRPDLGASEIRATWNEEEDGPQSDSIELDQITKITKVRALREMMALASVPEHDQDVNAGTIEQLTTFVGWREIHRRAKERRKGRKKS